MKILDRDLTVLTIKKQSTIIREQLQALTEQVVTQNYWFTTYKFSRVPEVRLLWNRNFGWTKDRDFSLDSLEAAFEQINWNLDKKLLKIRVQRAVKKHLNLIRDKAHGEFVSLVLQTKKDPKKFSTTLLKHVYFNGLNTKNYVYFSSEMKRALNIISYASLNKSQKRWFKNPSKLIYIVSPSRSSEISLYYALNTQSRLDFLVEHPDLIYLFTVQDDFIGAKEFVGLWNTTSETWRRKNHSKLCHLLIEYLRSDSLTKYSVYRKQIKKSPELVKLTTDFGALWNYLSPIYRKKIKDEWNIATCHYTFNKVLQYWDQNPGTFWQARNLDSFLLVSFPRARYHDHESELVQMKHERAIKVIKCLSKHYTSDTYLRARLLPRGFYSLMDSLCEHSDRLKLAKILGRPNDRVLLNRGYNR